MPTYGYKCTKCGEIEIFHGISEEDKVVCPECNSDGLKKLISYGSAIIIAGREMNQYKDVLSAKYWRDKNGVKHKVTPGDGHSGSTTVNRQTVSPEMAKARKKFDRARDKQNRIKGSYQRFSRRVKK